jgi:hypothetical protein
MCVWRTKSAPEAQTLPSRRWPSDSMESSRDDSCWRLASATAIRFLVAAGYRAARVTWDQLEDEPDDVVARIGRMIGTA